MTSPTLVHLEIHFEGERAGWISCALVEGSRRLPLAASDVFPPFGDVLAFLRAIATRRLPYVFYWDVEGKGATFEARPVPANASACWLHIQHDQQTWPWFNAEISREAMVLSWATPLRAFVQQRPERAESAWDLTALALAEFDAVLDHPVPTRESDLIAGSVDFSIWRWEEWVELDVAILGFRARVNAAESDRLWPALFDFMGHIAGGRLPATLRWPHQRHMDTIRSLLEDHPDAVDLEVPDLYTTIVAEPLLMHDCCRLRCLKTDAQRTDFPVLDEIVDRRQCVLAFCRTFQDFLGPDYAPLPDAQGQMQDLRGLPLAALRAAAEGRGQDV